MGIAQIREKHMRYPAFVAYDSTFVKASLIYYRLFEYTVTLLSLLGYSTFFCRALSLMKMVAGYLQVTAYILPSKHN
jgi:hypothetical protein